METTNFDITPDDIIIPIMGYLELHDLCRLFFCGSSTLNDRILHRNIVQVAKYRPKDPTNAEWPVFINSLSSLRSLEIRMPKYYEHMPLLQVHKAKLPTSLTKVDLTFGNANQFFAPSVWLTYPNLQHLDLDGIRNPNTRGVIGPSMTHLRIVGFSMSFPDFGSLVSLELDLYLTPLEVLKLPPTLTYLKKLTIFGIKGSGIKLEAKVPLVENSEEPLSGEENVAEAVEPIESQSLDPKPEPEPEPKRSNPQVVLSWPAGLKTLVFHRSDNLPALLHTLPKTLTVLDVASFNSEVFKDWPPSLVHLCLRAPYSGRVKAAVLPRNLRYLKASIDTSSLDELPQNLTWLVLIDRIDPSQMSLLPTSLLKLKCDIRESRNVIRDIPPNIVSLSTTCGPLRTSSLPRVLTSLRCKTQFLDQTLSLLPETITELKLDVLQSYDDPLWSLSLPPLLTSLSIHIPRGFISEAGVSWPHDLKHLTLNGFTGARFWELPDALLSLSVKNSKCLDTRLVMKRLPSTLTSFTMPDIILLDEDVRSLPHFLVTLLVHLQITPASFSLLPPTLNRLGCFRPTADPTWEDLLPDHCTLTGPRAW